MQDSKYFEENDDGEQVLASTADTVISISDVGATVSVSIVSAGESSVHTFDDEEGFYRISPQTHPELVDELDGVFARLNESSTSLVRNPYDGYEIVVEQTEVTQSDETAIVNGQTTAEYVVSPDTSEGKLLTLEDVFARLAKSLD